MHCAAVIDKDPDSAYGIRFPELPRCFSGADTFEEIVPDAIEAVSLYFEDFEPVPDSTPRRARIRIGILPGVVARS